MNPAWSEEFKLCSETLVMPVFALANHRGGLGQCPMLAMPMPRDIEPCRDPHPVARGSIVEKAHERRGASGPSDQPAMQPDRHHLGRILAFGIEHVEGILEIVEELVAAAETLRIDEPHVIGIERIG